jgi:hypothetical protein
MNVTFTLTGGSTSTAAGPFNISGTTNTDVTSELATGITKSQLLTGHTINSVNDAITGGTIASTGTCTTTANWSVTPLAPLTATLSYTFESGDYYFTLSEPILDDITINVATVNGHTTSNCNLAEDSANLDNPVTISAGETSLTHTSSVGGWGGITYIRLSQSITLGGSYGSIVDGGSFTTPSGTVVTFDIDTTCQVYAQ